jgi:hypothetical protein
MTTVVVTAALASRPGIGGGAWVRLNWLLGFKRLGFRVYFFEGVAPEACIDANGNKTSFAHSINRAFFDLVLGQFHLSDAAALICGEHCHGLPYDRLLEIASSAYLFVNLGGHSVRPELFRCFSRKAYVDLDPGFTQIWHQSGLIGDRLLGYDSYFSVGQNVGRSDCSIPSCGIRWHRVRPPIVLEHWPVTTAPAGAPFTTVAHWRSPSGPVELHGKNLGLKVHEFRKFMDLPRRVATPMELALRIHPNETKDLSALHDHGWRLADPDLVAADPQAFRSYVQESAGEFSAAQGVYVETTSGWMSDRTAAYLASGKPVLVQDTGLSRHYPVGEGLLVFRTLEEAVRGMEQITERYKAHCRTARSLAERYFDSDKVLRDFFEDADLLGR